MSYIPGQPVTAVVVSVLARAPSRLGLQGGRLTHKQVDETWNPGLLHANWCPGLWSSLPEPSLATK